MKKRLAAFATALFALTMPFWDGQAQADTTPASTANSAVVTQQSASAPSSSASDSQSNASSKSSTSSASSTTDSTSQTGGSGSTTDKPASSSSSSSSSDTTSKSSSSSDGNNAQSDSVNNQENKNSTPTSNANKTSDSVAASSSAKTSDTTTNTESGKDTQSDSKPKATSSSAQSDSTTSTNTQDSEPKTNSSSASSSSDQSSTTKPDGVSDGTSTTPVDRYAHNDATNIRNLITNDKTQPPHPNQESDKDAVDASIISGVKVSYSNKVGNQDIPTTNPTINSDIGLSMNLSIPEDIMKDLKTGDTFTYQLPKGVSIISSEEGAIENGGDGNDYGRYTIDTNGLVTLTFNIDQTNQANTLAGSLQFKGSFNNKVITTPGDVTKDFKFPGGESSDTITVHPSIDTTIDKSGATNKDLNPTAVNWQVVINKTMQHITNPSVTEDWDKQVQFGSVVVYPVTMNLDGTYTVDSAALSSDKYSVDTNGNVTFKDAIDQAYALKYVSPIQDSVILRDSFGHRISNTLFIKNTATLNGNNITPVPASATVAAVYQGFYSKSGPDNIDPYHHKYRWTIDYNSGDDLTNSNQRVLTDTLKSPLTYIDGSLKIEEKTYDAKTGKYVNTGKYLVKDTDYKIDVNQDKSSFTITMLTDAANQPLTIIYDSQIAEKTQIITSNTNLTTKTDPNNGAYVSTGKADGTGGNVDAIGSVSLENTAQINGYDKQTPNPSTDVRTGDLIKEIQPYNESSNGTLSAIDRGLKLVQWQVTINKSEYTMKGYHITDTATNAGLIGPYLPEGVLPAKQGVRIKDNSTGKDLLAGVDYTLKVDNDGSDGSNASFTVTFTNDIKHQLTMYYENRYDVSLVKTPAPENAYDFVNKTVADWTGIDNKPYTDIATNDFHGSKYEAYQGMKSGSYNPATKQISWTVVSNYNASQYPYYTMYDPIVGGISGVTDLHVVQGQIDRNGQFVAEANGTDPSSYVTKTIYVGSVVGNNYVVTGKVDEKGNVTPYSLTIPFGDPAKGNADKAYLSPAGDTFYQLGADHDSNGNKQVKYLVVINFGNSINNLPKGNTDTDGRAQLAFKVTFNTNVDGEQVAKTYPNTALTDYSSNGTTLANPRLSVTANVSSYQGNAYLSKAGERLGNDQATWTVAINRSQSTINNAVYEDTPDVNQHVDPKSIKLYYADQKALKTVETITKSNGTKVTETMVVADPKQPLTEGIDYDKLITIDPTTGQRKIKITFKHVINRAIAMTYQTELFFPKGMDSEVQFNNDGKLSGTEIVKQTTNTQDSDQIKITRSNATLVGTYSSISLAKVLTDEDADVKSSLAGVEFELLLNPGDESAESLLRKATTDAEGNLSFINLKSGVYYLKEVSGAPAGAMIADDLVKGTRALYVNATTTPMTFSADNKNLPGRAELLLQDSNMKPIIGAAFKLQKLGDNLKWSDYDGNRYVTDSNGEIVVDNLSTGTYRFTEFVRNFYGRAELQKKDAFGKALADATFKFQEYVNNTWIDYKDDKRTYVDLLTDKNGKIVVNNLLAGKYRFVETKAPDGYILDTTELPEQIISTPNTDVVPVIQFSSINYKGSYVFKKTQSDGTTPLSGARFKLQQLVKTADNGETVSDVRKDITSAADGSVSVSELAPGQYQLIETSAPTGYQLDTTPIKFKIVTESKDGHDDHTGSAMKNYRDQITLIKQDATGHPIINNPATFGLFTSKDDQQVFLSLDQNGNYFVNTTGQKHVLLQTDSNGKLTINGLPAGDYYLKELTAPIGYAINPETNTKFSIIAGQDFEDLHFTMIDYQGRVTFIKTGLSGAKLSGAVYQILDSNNIVVDTITTDVNGQAVSKLLALGKYNLQELTAPNGYLVNPNVVAFEIGGTADKEISVSATQQDFLGSAKIKKVNSKGIVLAGAKFSLFKEDGTAIAENLITDAQGMLTVNNLLTGKYYFVETAAPDHYLVNNQKMFFTISNQDNYKNNDLVTVDAGSLVDYQASVTLKKTATTSKKALQDAIFEIRRQSDGAVVASNLTTDANGLITFSGLNAGKYYFAEVKAPNHYQLNTKHFEFEVMGNVDKDVVIPEISVTNDEILGSVTLTKKGTDTQKVLNGAVFNLINPTTGQIIKAGLKADAGQVTVNDLAWGQYQFVETTAPDHYLISNDANSGLFIIDGSNPESSLAVTIDFLDKPVTKTKIHVTKQWFGTPVNTDHPQITIQLMKNGTVIASKVLNTSRLASEDVEFDDLDATDANGQSITAQYTVQEKSVPSHYTSVTEGKQKPDANGNVTLKNTYLPDLTAIDVTKRWSGVPDGILAPSEVTVQLFDNGKLSQTKVLTNAEGYHGVFDKLPVTDDQGKVIKYTIAEVLPQNGKYQLLSLVQDNSGKIVTITNQYVPDKVNVKVQKLWVGLPNGTVKPDVAVTLYANGKAVQQQALTAATGFKYTFTDLDKTDDTGKKIVYTVIESAVGGYKQAGVTMSDDGYDVTITNRFTPLKTSIRVHKTWVGIPANVTIPAIQTILYANGVAIDQAVLTSANKWTAIFDNLDQTDANGNTIVYSAAEGTVPDGFVKQTVGPINAVDGKVNLVNRFVPLKTSIKVNKTWLGTPMNMTNPAIQVVLYANGIAVDQAALTSADGWSASFDNLDETDANGHYIVYTVAENVIPAGYTSETTGQQTVNNGIVNLVNRYTPLKTSIKINKTWLGTPVNVVNPAIQAVLYANGVVTTRTVDLTTANGFTGAFTDLDETDANGHYINYTVAENAVPTGYTSETTGQQTAVNGVVNLKNRFTPIKTKLIVNKQWLGMPANVIAPEIQAILYINGKATNTIVTLNAKNHYTADFDNLDETDANGDQLTYTVAEGVVPAHYVALTTGAQVAKNGVATLQNRYVPSTINVEVHKLWQNVQKDVVVPAVTVVLYRNGVATDQQALLNNGNNWRTSFTNLATTDDNGQAIVWSVQEINVPAGFKASYQTDQSLTTITNTAELGQVVLHKVDSQNGVALANAVFDLFDGQGQLVRTHLVTDANGDLAVDGLAWGSYSFVETVAPKGYALAKDSMSFDIAGTTSQLGVRLNFDNTKLPDVPNIPGIPNVPNVPNFPNVPGKPNIPNVPETPQPPVDEGPKGHLPHQPNIPNIPSIPGTPVPPVNEGPKGHFPHQPRLPKVPNVPAVPQNEGPKGHLPRQSKPVTPTVPKVAGPKGHSPRVTQAHSGTPVVVVSHHTGTPAPGHPAKGQGHGEGHGVGLPQTGEQNNVWALVGIVLFAFLALFGLRRKLQF